MPQPVTSSWDQLDLSELVAALDRGDASGPTPTVGRLSDGSFWLYAAAVNGLAGESGSGKTWTSLATMAAELADGKNVVCIDLEDSPLGITARLLALGVPSGVLADRRRFAYVRPEEAFRDDVRPDFWALLGRMHPSLVVLDSTGESMALEGVDPNSDDGVAQWFQRVAGSIARHGPAVLLIDHMPKADRAGSAPIGSHRKKAAISGVQMIQSVKHGLGFAKGRSGEARIKCTKDRHGNFPPNEDAIRLIVNPEPARGDTGVAIVMHRVGDDEDWAPTAMMAAISKFLEAASGPLSTHAIKKGVKGQSRTQTVALGVLANSGYVTLAAGARNAKEYTHVKPYRLGDAVRVPDDAVDDSSGCTHPWHADRCNSDWCHSGHRGKCNQLVDRGFVLDADGEIISQPADIVLRREAQLRHITEQSTEPPTSGVHFSG